MSEEEFVLDVDSEEVVSRLGAAVDRALAEMARDAPEITLAAKRARDRLIAALKEDAACIALLEGAWREGRQDATLGAVAGEGGVQSPEPDWSDVVDQGTALAVWRDEHACRSCVHGKVCTVSRNDLIPEALVVISRCAVYEPAAVAAEDASG